VIVPDWLHCQALANPHAPAVLVPGLPPVDYGELEARVVQLTRRLATAGVGRGDRVACLLHNGLPLVELVHAVPRIGAALAPLDPRLSAPEAAASAGRVRPRLVLGESETVPAAVAAAAAGGGELHVTEPGKEPLSEVTPSSGTLEPVLDLDAPHTIVFTSGTSGEPRPVILTAGNHLWSALATACRLGVHRGDRWLACLPLHHVGGLAIALRSAIHGTALVVHRRFDPDAVTRALATERITLLSLVPTMLRRLVAALAERSALASLRCVLVGGAPASLELLVDARARGLPVAPTYGLTEAASQVATAPPDDANTPPECVGQPLLPTSVRIVVGGGRQAAPGETGEIHVRGPTVTPGYLAADGSVSPATVRGWLATRDLGWRDERGALTVRGRLDEVILTGGEKVSPTEVETALLRHPAVADVGVAGLPDPEWGEVVAAWVVPRPGARPSLEELRAACRGRLAAHKLPRRLFVVEALPRTAAGKLRRISLRADAPTV
jgi:O-succinylbenzoic acid--CoA ligase